MRQLRASVEALLLHVHPRAVPADALRLSRTLGAGGAALVLILLAGVSGAVLLAAYDPSPERAHAAVLRLARDVPSGAFLRSVHRWAADGALGLAAVHLLRVAFRGAFLRPRQANWVVGLAVLATVVVAAYTGRLLPWDQDGFWSIHISSAMLELVPITGGPLRRLLLGGDEVGPRTLALFYGLHVGIVPLALAALLALHFWQVRRCGGVLPGAAAAPGSARGPLVPAQRLVLREGVAALVTSAAVLLAAAIFDAPLGAPASRGMSPDPATAPWFLAGLQELLVHVHPTFGAVAWPSMVVGLLVALPALAGRGAASGAWFHTARGARRAVSAALAGAGFATLAIFGHEPLRHRPSLLAPLPAWIGAGILPLLGAAALTAAIVRRTRRDGGTRLEAVQAALAAGAAAALVLTATGLAARGPGMALVAPFTTGRAGGAP